MRRPKPGAGLGAARVIEVHRRRRRRSAVSAAALAVTTLVLGSVQVEAASKPRPVIRSASPSDVPSRRGVGRDGPNPPGTITWSTPNASGNLGGPTTGGGGGGGK